MAKQNKHKKRITHLALICTLTTILLITSTYAWFIGMRTVSVDSFDVEIAAIDGLSLSLDGETWTESLDVTQAPVYEGNTNTWAPSGLKPVSTIGKIDTQSATLKLFEKASLTPTAGGYRLLASRVPNNVNNEGKYTEQEGYVAFDLFIKNLSGKEYYPGAADINNEEAIYLTNDSTVTVAKTGVKNTGIENSVRVAFAQIGRVIATTSEPATITGLTCATTENGKNGTTGICDRTATIWEPNDRQHTQAAIDNYVASCKHRTGDKAYDSACKAVVDGLPNNTYAISNVIHYLDSNSDAEKIVDVYDGADYNGYTTSIASTPNEEEEGKFLTQLDSFTDSEKLLTGTERPEFLRLAPNSITKVRVYIYIEGQDVDNFDLASIGKKIAVKFGFTKQRFNEDDINYEGAASNEGFGPFVQSDGQYVDAKDKTKPFIEFVANGGPHDGVSLEGNTLTVQQNTVLSDLDTYVTAKAYDKKTTYESNESGEFTVNTVTKEALQEATVNKSGTVNAKVPGTYQVIYSVADAAGNVGTKVLRVVVSPAV